jgi:flagellar motor switch protein FliG
MPTEKVNLSGVRKAAILLTVLGEESAATVFRDLNPLDLQLVADEVASLGTIPVELSIQVIEEYQRMTQAQDYLSREGMISPSAFSSRLLEKAKRRAFAAPDQGTRSQTPLSRYSAPILRSSQDFLKPSIHRRSLSSSVNSAIARHRPC